ncbi:MAG: uracil phosphoribosyltransferase [Actinomycetota bacterium]|nr:uracil phosphoribosyltransferase [Actinomycetota bacterium]
MRVTVVEHPVLAAVLTGIRDERSSSSSFVGLVDRATNLLLSPATAELPTIAGVVTTPVGPADCKQLTHEPLLVPVLRAGLGMLDSARRLLPESPVAFVGLRRDEATARATWYLDALPDDLTGVPVIVLEPMIATGGTLGDVITRLARLGSPAVTVVSLLCAPEGIAAIERATSDVPCDVHIVAAAVDQGLNDRHFIVPGLGDAGDRLFGEG